MSKGKSSIHNCSFLVQFAKEEHFSTFLAVVEVDGSVNVAPHHISEHSPFSYSILYLRMRPPLLQLLLMTCF
jgi:hypothetical protein